MPCSDAPAGLQQHPSAAQFVDCRVCVLVRGQLISWELAAALLNACHGSSMFPGSMRLGIFPTAVSHVVMLARPTVAASKRFVATMFL